MRPFYIVIEKILGEGETLQRFPGISGTTGYEWMNVLTHLLIDPKGLDALDGARRRQRWRRHSFRFYPTVDGSLNAKEPGPTAPVPYMREEVGAESAGAGVRPLRGRHSRPGRVDCAAAGRTGHFVRLSLTKRPLTA